MEGQLLARLTREKYCIYSVYKHEQLHYHFPIRRPAHVSPNRGAIRQKVAVGEVELSTGSIMGFVGANGAGKSRKLLEDCLAVSRELVGYFVELSRVTPLVGPYECEEVISGLGTESRMRHGEGPKRKTVASDESFPHCVTGAF
jgi:hypothetical protein